MTWERRGRTGRTGMHAVNTGMRAGGAGSAAT
jgi:hypothetical protein